MGRDVVTLGLVGWPRNAVSQGWNKFSNSFYGGRWAALDCGGTRDHTCGFDKLEVRRHVVE
jgi:hypothetical protein